MCEKRREKLEFGIDKITHTSLKVITVTNTAIKVILITYAGATDNIDHGSIQLRKCEYNIWHD